MSDRGGMNSSLGAPSWVCYATATDLLRAIRTKKIKARDALEALIRRCQRVNGELNAVVVWNLERARARADRCDDALYKEGRLLGPLHGLPMTVKENNDVSGLPTTVGNEKYRGRIAKENEVMIQLCIDAGAVIFGKTNLPEDAMDIQSYNSIYGSSSNPWDPRRTPGGSSGGGAAAVAAGLSPVELGGDVGGSIRTPAAFCGIFGHKPTFNLIPKRGPHLAKRPKEISVRGILARTAIDLRLMLDIVAREDRSSVGVGWRLHLRPPTRFRSLADFRVAVWKDDLSCRVDDDVRIAADDLVLALRARGAMVNCSARPDFDLQKNIETYQLLTAANAALKDDGELLGGDVAAPAVTLRQYRLAQESQGDIRESWDRFFENFDILIVPSHCTPAFTRDESPKKGRMIDLVVDGSQRRMPYWKALFWAVLTNVGLLPSTTFPCGIGRRSRLPIGLNAVGKEWSDLTTIRFAHLLEKECGSLCRFRVPPRYGNDGRTTSSSRL